MGEYGFPSRILSAKLHSYLTYTQPEETAVNALTLGHIDPITLCDLYGFRSITEETRIFGVTGYPLKATLSPYYHNMGYRKHNMDAVYIPIKGKDFGNVLDFADLVNIQGLSITVPHKETALACLTGADDSVRQIGACNTIVRKSDTDQGWHGYDTDATGMSRALQDFLGKKNLARMKVSILGSGGAARAAACAVKQKKGKASVLNRTISRAKSLAARYGFRWSSLGRESIGLLEEYGDLIIQATTVGLNATVAGPDTDPLFFYNFNGKEAIYDLIYTPEVTPILARAKKAGCRVSNGRSMLNYQAFEQFSLFTGVTY
jgi:3-dehydroquinate dehydratase/shikimate dehydrogenase